MIATLSPQSSAPRIIDPTFDIPTLRAALAQLHREQPEHGYRLDRAAAIVALRRIERWGPGWLVESEREPERYYLVSRDAFGVRCICADYRRRGGLACKHVLAILLLDRCERLAAQAEQALIPFPTPALNLDEPVPFVLTAKGLAALDEPAPSPVA